VIEEVNKVYPLLSFYVLFDAMGGMGNGLIVGIGRQARASIFTIIGYWMIGVPVSATLGFAFDMSLMGLWIGSLVAVIFCTSCYFTLLIKTDWH
jgi:MATE family multidrug resistance protein